MADDRTRHPGPSLATLTQRLALTSPDMLDRHVDVPALVADVVIQVDGTVLDAAGLAWIDRTFGPDAPRRTRAGAAVACWLLTDPALLGHPGVAAAAAERGGTARWFLHVVMRLVSELAHVRDPRTWVHQDTGREEAARAALAAGDLLPAGESEQEAADRWQAVSTAYREVASRAMAEEVRRAEELARALAEKRAKEAAAQYSNY
ncbi:hypothetical protein [Actinotalea sp. JY-7885]|uniref:hypothetical protein n=1 Tax=Actinotalea sp. JY-7885 TaxID=2758576 RepID=UPI00165E59AD|nr:hypothetical protein [Actinotalea sp. JY-7885]